MVVITVEAYQNAKVHTITVKNKDFFWVKMKDLYIFHFYSEKIFIFYSYSIRLGIIRHKEYKRSFKKKNMW